MSNPVGRPPDLVAQAWALRYGMTVMQCYRLSDLLMRQLSFCKTEEARRIILGISK